ncbi:MAG: D-alanyl-D-alanine carboxypeptidase/D-alanyl-D-alanine-endopeptidase, partial [Chlamydiota bacterium]
MDTFFQNSENFQKAHIGIFVMDVQTGKEIFSRNSNQFFIPASLQKIPTSLAALSLLGKDYLFFTDLEYEGEIKENILYGNVWIRGGGDPTLPLDIVNTWEKALHKKNIFSINGSIFVDASFFETVSVPPSWSFQDIGNYYGAGASSLTIHNNFYIITFQPGVKEGESAKILSLYPPIFDLVYHNEVTTGAAKSGDQVCIFGSEYSPIQFYRGTVPIDVPSFSVKAAIFDPPLFAGRLLQEKIPATNGVKVFRTKNFSKNPANILHCHTSPPLAKIIQDMNLHSINLFAEHLFKAMGEGKSEIGRKRIETFLQSNQIEASIQDGSGLSSTNLWTPKDFVHLLCIIRKSPFFPTIYDSLSEMGKSGTLQKWTSIKNGVIKAKTGSMSHIYNLRGYLFLPL